MNELLNNIMETGDQNPIENPVSQAQEPFKDRAFCIVGDEMKAKMEALGLDEEDISNIIHSENYNSEFLELIDVYFPQVQKLKELIKLRYLENYGEYRSNMSDMSEQEFDEMLNEETKNSLKNMISWYRSLKILFTKYPGKIKEVYGKSYWADFMHLLRYSSDREKYQFDFDLAIEFFELAEKIKRNRKGGDKRFDPFDEISDAYENLYEKIQKPELFNNLLKLCISAGEQYQSLLNALRYLSSHEIEKIAKNYELFIELGILAGKNNDQFLRFNRKLQLPDDENKKDLIIAGWRKLGEDFFYIYESPIIFEIAKNHPEKYVKFCENLKKLADLSGENYKFYSLCLKEITDFTIEYSNSWEFLYKSAEILGKYTPNVIGTGIKFLEVLYIKFPNESQEILQKITQIGMNAQNGADVLFMSSGLNFLSKYLEKDGKQKVFQMAEKMVELGNKYLTENNNGAFYSQKENPLTYGLGFLALYLDNFGEKYDEILERVMMLIGSSGKASGGLWEKYFLGMSDFISEEYSVSLNPQILHDVLDFYEKIYTSQKEVIIQKGLKADTNNFEETNKDIELIFQLGTTYFNQQDIISKAMIWLLKNNQDKIIPFVKNLFILNDLQLNIDVKEFLGKEIKDEKFQRLEDEVKKKLKTIQSLKSTFAKVVDYSETVQEVFGERIDKKFAGFEIVPEMQRKENIQKINSKQKENLRFYGVNTSEYDQNQRTLVLYYRAENMNAFHFSLLTQILYKYIHGGHSKVFDRLLITSRGKDNYPHEIHQIGEIPYEYDDFKHITNVFANTIHFTHGSVIEDDYMYTTPHIIGLANLAHSEDKKRVPDTGFYIPLYLRYGETHGNYTQEHIEIDKSQYFKDIFDEIIRAVRACEEMMIKNIK